ncbi:hypothetical protein Nepgr_028440 [Nepenthes gracilis]|uniref:Uncharacterized protein n=1 Tax=Nepenthes gracilis TaxID=150966 RepID=A0AAD3TDP6_NEPGR|nr:hypothetical protein Nepgr_028440 [Nepenthes gracilis]
MILTSLRVITEKDAQEIAIEYTDRHLASFMLIHGQLVTEYTEFTQNSAKTRNSLSADRAPTIDQVAKKMEEDLILLGATTVENTLLNGVPQCLANLTHAVIKRRVWTEKKKEATNNVGFACKLLRQGMKQVSLHLDTSDIRTLEKIKNKDVNSEDQTSCKILRLEGRKIVLGESTNGVTTLPPFWLATPSMVEEQIISALEDFKKSNSVTPFCISYNAVDGRQQAAISPQRFDEGNPISILDGIFMAIQDAVSVSRLHSCGIILMGKAIMHARNCGFVPTFVFFEYVTAGWT